MAHLHSIYDSDSHFRIDPITRLIKNEASSKVTLIQGDHNSERFTFEMPRYIEGHDMSLCNKIRVHFSNGEHNDVYETDDMQLSNEDDNIVIFSWLISSNATGTTGVLAFMIEFLCLSDEMVDYRWNTAIYSAITIGKGMNNSASVVYEYADILEQWKQELTGVGSGTVETNTEEWYFELEDGTVITKKVVIA